MASKLVLLTIVTTASATDSTDAPTGAPSGMPTTAGDWNSWVGACRHGLADEGCCGSSGGSSDVNTSAIWNGGIYFVLQGDGSDSHIDEVAEMCKPVCLLDPECKGFEASNGVDGQNTYAKCEYWIVSPTETTDTPSTSFKCFQKKDGATSSGTLYVSSTLTMTPQPSDEALAELQANLATSNTLTYLTSLQSEQSGMLEHVHQICQEGTGLTITMTPNSADNNNLIKNMVAFLASSQMCGSGAWQSNCIMEMLAQKLTQDFGTDAPTGAPTTAATIAPTGAPTTAATIAPTSAPSVGPRLLSEEVVVIYGSDSLRTITDTAPECSGTVLYPTSDDGDTSTQETTGSVTAKLGLVGLVAALFSQECQMAV